MMSAKSQQFYGFCKVEGVKLIDGRVYEEIALDYPLAAAKSFASLSDPFKFVYVSGN